MGNLYEDPPLASWVVVAEYATEYATVLCSWMGYGMVPCASEV